MAGKTTPWWREVLTRAVRGIRARVAVFFRSARKPADLPLSSLNQEDIPEEEADLTDHFPQSKPESSNASEREKQQSAPEVSLGAAPAAEKGAGDVPESPADLLAEAALGIDTDPIPTEGEPDSAEEQSEAVPSVQDGDIDDSRAEAVVQTVPEALIAPEAVESKVPEAEAEPEPVQADEEEGAGDVPESPADLLAEAALGIDADPIPTEGEPDRAEEKQEVIHSINDRYLADSRAEAVAQTVPEALIAPEAVESMVPEAEAEPEPLQADEEEGAGDVPESPADLLAEAALGIDAGPRGTDAGPDSIEERPQILHSVQDADMGDLRAQTVAEAVPGADRAQADPEGETTKDSEAVARGEAEQPQSVRLPPQVPAVAHEAIKREPGPDTSPVSVFVNQVYEGPFDLLLDLIRKQDIDIYDIPIAKITAQFLAYVNELKASDMDVAGEFIYTASLLIHIKSKMLLPREPKGGDDGQEDPRRELVERLLEHERFKNAAQMLQQKQMLEAATWTNPGVREFRENAGESEIGPEIAADTTDLVRVFRVILERARNRPVINVQEDSVTVGQMIQFLGRRLTMEDKPLALRKLLAHTKSERALIAMFLALLELVRLQAILLRQDRQFSEIFIKKNAGFDSVITQGMARDDWQ